LTSLVLTLTETLRYKGALGQWSWVLHRITGLGVVLFLVLHVIDTSWAYFYPDLYVKAIAVYQSPLFTIGEFALVACVVYHAYNGLRIALIDFKPVWWRHQEKAARYVLIATAVTLVPVFVLMFSHVLKHYQSPDVQVLGLDAVIESQIPFIAGFVIAGFAALLLSAITMAILPKSAAGPKAKPTGSQIERFWWSFMRLSGVLIIPLVFGHLAAMHVLQGVFDMTVAGMTVVGVPASGDANALWNGINASGTAVEFVGERWNHLLGGVAIWRVFDAALLMLVTIHGFNGLRYVLTDYTSFNPMLKRAAIYLCIMGAVVLLVTGIGALLGTIDQTAVDMAKEATAKLFAP
jgi:succinate dehydrogenase / fumarate reductase, cytochrome b subunit